MLVLTPLLSIPPYTLHSFRYVKIFVSADISSFELTFVSVSTSPLSDTMITLPCFVIPEAISLFFKSRRSIEPTITALTLFLYITGANMFISSFPS